MIPKFKVIPRSQGHTHMGCLYSASEGYVSAIVLPNIRSLGQSVLEWDRFEWAMVRSGQLQWRIVRILRSLTSDGVSMEMPHFKILHQAKMVSNDTTFFIQLYLIRPWKTMHTTLKKKVLLENGSPAGKKNHEKQAVDDHLGVSPIWLP